jgi:peptidoglycan hydrolase-like protein with peptidoglycan-binding domain
VKRRTVLLTVAAGVVVAGGVGAVVAVERSHNAPVAQATQLATARVERGDLSAVIAATGALAYEARPDGSAFAAINNANGIYTRLPQAGDEVGCGTSLYRVDEKPVILLCGATPLYRDLAWGVTGDDVAELNQDLHVLGYDKAAGVSIRPDDHTFSSGTQRALVALQHATGLPTTGSLDVTDAVVLPAAVRVASVTGQLGGPAKPGTPVVLATTDALIAQVSLDPSEQSDVPVGAHALITLPGNSSLNGKVACVGSAATSPQGSQSDVGNATILVTIELDDPAKAHGLNAAAVRVQITTAGVKDVLSVPVVALVGNADGGYAVDVAGNSGQHDLVAVKLGLFDDASGRVQVTGNLNAGDAVVVPS